MRTEAIPWGMWYGNGKLDLSFPNPWQVTVTRMKGGPDIGDDGIRRAFAQPVGASQLREVAQGRRDAAILIDDLTRPTPSYRILPFILEELAAGGLQEGKVRIVCAVAAHRPMTRQDLVKKIGLDLVERLAVVNHDAYDNLELYGNSSLGIPIWVNREFARSDLKIAAGMITPRGGIFGGGSKLLLPGACGRQTIYLNHRYCPGDNFREHIAEVARIVGLEYIVNPLLNADGDIMAVVTGDPESAYWHGVSIAKDLYSTEVPEEMDVVVCNSWPKDTEGTQAVLALVPLHGTLHKALKANGTIVITSASSEGLGFHSVLGPGTLLRGRGDSGFGGRTGARPEAQQILFSPNLNRYDVRSLYGDRVRFCKTWNKVIEVIATRHGDSPRVAIFPCGALQYGVT